MTVEKRKYMNINAMTNYELIQQKELKDLKSEGYLLSLIHISEPTRPY